MISGIAKKETSTEIKFRVGDERLLKVSESASVKVKSLLQRQGRSEGVLRVEKTGIVHTVCGKVSFNSSDLIENISKIYNSLLKSRPPSVKGQFLEKMSISSTMGPGVKINVNSIG